MLNTLKPPKGAKRPKKRLGRGEASGQGKTAGRGHKGAKARSGGGRKWNYEGGQTPLHRRLPKRGFTSVEHREYLLVNLNDLSRLPSGATAGISELLVLKARKRAPQGIKVLGTGELKHAVTVTAHAFSASAREAIAKAGGKVNVIEPPKPRTNEKGRFPARKPAAPARKSGKKS